MSRGLRDRLRDYFSRLEQGSRTGAEYEAHFHKLARHTTSIRDTKYERVLFSVCGLRLPLCISTQCLVVVAWSFVVVIDHA